MTSLFPDPGQGFFPKGDSGNLPNYCTRCNQHISAHASKWIPHVGSVRECPDPSAHTTSVAMSPGRAAAVPPPSDAEEYRSVAASAPANPPYGTDYNATGDTSEYRQGKRASPLRNAESPPRPRRTPQQHYNTAPPALSGAGIVVTKEEAKPRPSKGLLKSKHASNMQGAGLQFQAQDD